MLSLLTAGALFCAGLTQSYDVYLNVDIAEKTVTGALADPDGFKRPVTLNFSGLQLAMDCLVSDQFELCFTSRHALLKVKSLSTPESGVLECKPKNRM